MLLNDVRNRLGMKHGESRGVTGGELGGIVLKLEEGGSRWEGGGCWLDNSASPRRQLRLAVGGVAGLVGTEDRTAAQAGEAAPTLRLGA
jgi:hypothetical protein